MENTRRVDVPLRLSNGILWLAAVICMVYASLPFIFVPQRFREMATINDFANYWSAGATVGTKVLTDHRLHAAWQTAHHLTPQPFVYPPAFAWAYSPFKWLAPMPAFVAEQLVMVLLFVVSAWLVARIYGFKPWFAGIAVFAWGPTISTIESGQNTGLALVLALAAILGLVKRNGLLLGLAVGLMLYKPTDAAVMILLVIARREWRALAIIGLCAALWFAASTYSAGGDWLWPATYAATVREWYALHSGANPLMVFTLPTILLAHGAPALVVLAASCGLLLASIPVLARASAIEAGSIAPLLGLAASVHAWGYAAALILPALCFVMVRVPDPHRTRLVAVAYALGAIGVSMAGGGIALSIVCLGGAAGVLWKAYGPTGWLWSACERTVEAV